MTAPYSYNLSSAPRHVPWPVRGQVLFGGFLNQFGWLWLGFSLVFVWIFGLNADFTPASFALGPTETARGIVSAVELTNASENETDIYAIHYSFRVERFETEYQGISYTTGREFSPGQEVTVEYISTTPTTSRIQGARGGMFSPWILCVVGIFPLVGLGFLIAGLVNGIKSNRLLTHGQIGWGTLVAKEPTNTRINGQTVYKLTFEFTTDDGRRGEVIAKTHLPYILEDEPKEQLLYDPYNPSSGVMLDNLPGAPDIDELGNLQVVSFGRSILPLVLPAVVLLVHSTIFVFIMI
jgi:hypothetical protein